MPVILRQMKDNIRRLIIERNRRSQVVFFSDTTLRDGEQMPGAALRTEDKVVIARAIAELGVHSLDVGFPASGASEIKAVQEIVRKVRGPIMTGLSRCVSADIDGVAEALSEVPLHKRGIALFLGTSPIHRKYKLQKNESQILDMVTRSIDYARRYFEIVAFSAEDTSRTELPFLCEVYREAINSGASTISVTDTLGILTPEQVRDIIRRAQNDVPNIDRVLLAVHFHNDLGLATANSLAAVAEGVHIVQCTVNGIGERAGNASLEEVAMALKLHEKQYGRKIKIDLTKLTSVSRLVAEKTGIPIAPNKPVVGSNIFATEAGIHQDGLLKNIETYLPFRPEDVGANGIHLVLGTHSGRAAFIDRLGQLKFNLSEKQIDTVMCSFKALSKDRMYNDKDALRQIVQDLLAEERKA